MKPTSLLPSPRRTGRLTVAALAASAFITGAAFAATVDVVVMNDGREFIGEIIEERAGEIVIRTEIAGIEAPVTLRRSEIARILEDQDVDVEAEEAEEAGRREIDAANDRGETFGVRRVERREGVPAMYVVPWHGQTGTDINLEVYEMMVEDIRAEDPDYIVIEVMCEDYEIDWFAEPLLEEFGRTDIGALDEYRRIIDLFHDELGDIPQVVWIRQAIGMSSVLALAWDTIYMHPDARLEGADRAAANFEGVRDDADTYGKYREAYMSLIRGIALRSGREGGYKNLPEAMIRPDFTLSVTWRGRETEWHLDTSGEYDIDRSTRRVAKFDARTAENFGISAGTAENLDDVALLMGLREYDVIDDTSRGIFNDYVEDWRRTFERLEEAAIDYQQHLSWANGADFIAYYGRAKNDLETILSCIRQYEAVRVRAGMQYGLQEQNLRLQIRTMEETLAAARRGARGAGRAGGGRRGPGGVNPGG